MRPASSNNTSSTKTPTAATPAGLLRRTGALCYDALLLLALWMMTLLPFVIANNEATSAWWVPVVFYLEAAGYYTYSWLKSGQTLGMRTWQLKLVNEQGTLIDFKAALLRLLIAPLSLAACGLGYFALYWGTAQQTWHDRASLSYVVRLPKE